MRKDARQNRWTGRRTDRLSGKGRLESHPFIRKPVNMRGYRISIAVTAQRIVSLLVRQDQDDIWPACSSRTNLPQGRRLPWADTRTKECQSRHTQERSAFQAGIIVTVTHSSTSSDTKHTQAQLCRDYTINLLKNQQSALISHVLAITQRYLQELCQPHLQSQHRSWSFWQILRSSSGRWLLYRASPLSLARAIQMDLPFMAVCLLALGIWTVE